MIKQAGVKDCGVYVLANLTALCFKMDLAVTHFNQDLNPFIKGNCFFSNF